VEILLNGTGDHLHRNSPSVDCIEIALASMGGLASYSVAGGNGGRDMVTLPCPCHEGW
jgi:hypothetical protein